MNLQVNSLTQADEKVSALRGGRAGSRLGARMLLWAFALCALLAASPSSAVAQQSCGCGSGGGSTSCDKVKIGFAASVCSARGYTVSLGGRTATGSGSCTADTWVTTEKQEVELTLDKPYKVVAGQESCATHIIFDVPKGYRLRVDGVETRTIDKGGTTKGSGDGTWEVVVHRCSECDESEGVETCDLSVGSINWSVSLGKLSDGRSAQTLSIREEFLSAAIYTPAALTYSPPLSGEIDVVRSGDGQIRQIKVPRALADVAVISPQEYEVRFYDPANVGAKSGGLYPVTGQPFAKWNFKNPDPSSTTRLQISETEGGTTKTSEYRWDAVTNTWALDEAAGTRVETKTVSYLTDTSRVETSIIKDGTGKVISKTERTIHTFPWGDEVLEMVIDPDGAALKTTYAYYEDPAQAGRYRKLKSVALPTGSWEKYDYDSQGNQTVVLRPWKDLPLASATESNSHATFYTYTNSDGITRSPYPYLVSSVTVKIEGVVVRKTAYAYTGTQIGGEPATVAAETVYASASASLTTTTTTYHSTASSQLANKVASVVRPNGTKETYNYEKGDYVAHADPALGQFTPNPGGAAWRETVTHGTSSSPDGVALKTTKETAVHDRYGHVVLTESYVYTGTGYERAGWAAMDYDGRGNLTRTRRSNGEVMTVTWDGDRMASSTDAAGVETVYTYDALGRLKTRTAKGVAASAPYPAQPDMVTTYTYDAEDRVVSETVTGGGASLSRSATYDGAGRARTETNTEGLTTIHTYSNGGRTHTVTYPGGATITTDAYLDGQKKDVTGTAVIAHHYEYATDAGGTQSVQDFTAGVGSPRWTKTTSDWLGRPLKVETPGFTGQSLVRTFAYNGKGQLIARAVSSGATKLTADMVTEYDALGRAVRNGSDLDSNGLLEPGSTDRFTESDFSFRQEGTDWFDSIKVSTYLTDNDATKTDLMERWQRLNNFPAAASGVTVSEIRTADESGQFTTAYRTIDRAAKKVTVTVDAPDSNVDSVQVGVNDLLQSSTPSTQQAATTFTYDGLGRAIGVNSPQTGAASRTYNPTTGQLTSESDAAQTTVYDYYPATHASAGRVRSATDAKGKKTLFEYSARGEVTRTWGDAEHPVEYVYDDIGQRTEMRTYRGGQNWAATVWPSATTGAADTTRWVYNGATGLVEKRRDAAGREMSYGYDALGRVTTRAWARTDALGNPVSVTYAYDPLTGQLTGMDYSDSTPDAALAYDRGGRERAVTDAAGARTRTYNARGGLKTESISGGILDLVQVNANYDDHLRRQYAQAVQGASVVVSQSYAYDASGRLETIASGGQNVTYGYHPASGLLNTTSYNGGTVASRSYDALGRAQSFTTTPAADAPQSHTYAYNSLSQRTRVTREDGSYWAYEYDDRGELTSGKKFWPDNTPVFGAQTEYAFDNVGNRTSSRAGGNTLGALRQSAYTVNSLNQYAQRTVPGAADVTGTANAAATVSVNNEPAARRGDYFYKELSVNNAAGPVYAQVGVVGARNNFGAGGEDAVTERGGRVFVPQAAEAYSHDADGNLTADGRWAYTWDAENRLTSMEARNNVPAEAKLRLEFAYDWSGRRIQKKVYAWNAGASSYQLQSVTKFVYDGWNLMAELDGTGALVRSYVWGQDLSGSLEGAGGVGGLLLVRQGGGTYQVGYDASGNATTLVNAATGKIAASYEFDPFGNTLKAVGDFAASNPFRFSTKYADAETGLVYFGERYYQPQTGRWLSRDPLGENGGLNLYAFVSNNPVSLVDPTGLYEIDVHYYLTYFLARQTGCFTKEEAKLVAEGDKGSDDDARYAPAQGKWHAHSILPGKIGRDQRQRHEHYHALTNPANHQANLQRLLDDAQLPDCLTRQNREERRKEMPDKLMAFGRYLHYAQDMFSHQDYPDPWAGHGIEFLRNRAHMPDKTFGTGYLPVIQKVSIGKYLPPLVTVNWDTKYDRVARAEAMVWDTWQKLKNYSDKNKCGCSANDDNLRNAWPWVSEFLKAYAGEDDQDINDLPDVLKAKINKLRNMPWN